MVNEGKWVKENLELWQSSKMEEAYAGQNYKEIVWNKSNKICIIFFSSNGLYYPNTMHEFERSIIREDRYEWESTAVSSEIQQYAGKVILVRDVYKQWYVKGINHTYNSIDMLLALLIRLTEGYEVVTVGSSSGGYAAVLFGIVLRAKKIYSFSGQFSIEDEVKDYYWLSKYSEYADRACYYNLSNFLVGNNIPIFYFYPAKCDQDIMQYNLIKANPSINIFALDCSIHGKTLNSDDMPWLLSRNVETLKWLCHKFKGILLKADLFHGGQYELE